MVEVKEFSLIKTAIIFVVSINAFASDECAPIAKVYAADSIREILLDDWQHENKMGSNKIGIEIGQPKLQKDSILPTGVVAGYWVPVQIRSGDNKWESERLFLFGKKCTRNLRAELEAGKKVEKALSKKKE